MITILKSESEKLEKYKNILIEQGDEIFEDVLINIPSRELDIETMKFAMEKQDDSDRIAGAILGLLYNSIIHIPAKKLFGDINMLVEHMMRRLDGSRFYIYLSAQLNCNIKSNTFMATMAMCQNNEMVKGLEDFICAQAPLYTFGIKESITDYVYLDDATFSGLQLQQNICLLEKVLGEHARNCTLHIVIPYINPSIIDKVRMKRYPFRHIEWYTTNTYPKPVSDLVNDMFSMHPEAGSSRIYSTLDKILGEKSSYPMTKSYSKSLFYTDLKVPDYVSVYTAFLLDHGIIYNSERTRMKDYGRELIKGCMPRFPSSIYVSSDGNDCPYPLYKEQKWRDFAKSWIPDHFTKGTS